MTSIQKEIKKREASIRKCRIDSESAGQCLFDLLNEKRNGVRIGDMGRERRISYVKKLLEEIENVAQ